MRTTLTISDDLAAQLERLRRERNESMKEIVDLALREGLSHIEAPEKPVRFRTRTVRLGRPRLPNLDDVSAALEAIEGESHR